MIENYFYNMTIKYILVILKANNRVTAKINKKLEIVIIIIESV